jgi:SNF2-related domain
LNISVSPNACRSANAILTCQVPFRSEAGGEWSRGIWKEVDKVHERSTFKALAWFLEPIKNVDDRFDSWQSVQTPPECSNCERCAPTPPALEWKKVNKKDVAFENTVQAGAYERNLKRRPSPFVTQLKLDNNNIGMVRIGVNIPSLLHRASSRLPSEHRTENMSWSWRLNNNFIPMARLDLPKFVIPSNKLDPEYSQPPSFRIPLRKEQLRSLHWMLAREAPDATPFVEEEISEAILAPLGWRAEGRAERVVHIKGGVLADQVGYGKTAITLGLIDCSSKDVENKFKKAGRIDGKISVKATVVVVPPHLTKQWDSECRKFSGKRFKTVVLSTATSLNSLKIEDVQNADIVIIASNLFKSSVYLENLESLGACGALPSKDGRYFNERLQAILTSLRAQTNRLQDEGSAAVMKQIHQFRREGMFTIPVG